jgi:hypothetical protein
MPNIGIIPQQPKLIDAGAKTLLKSGTEHWRSSYSNDHSFRLSLGARAQQPKWSLHKTLFGSNAYDYLPLSEI